MTFDKAKLDKELDRVKSKLFLGNNSAFLGSIMCSLGFEWDESIPTAATNYKNIYWNPQFFSGLTLETRKTVLLHEMDHVARLHEIRRGNRDPKIWNYACDIRINNDLENRAACTFEGIEWVWKDHGVDIGGIKAEEQIYDWLVKNAIKVPDTGAFGKGDGGDMLPMPDEHKQVLVNTVIRAIQQAKASGGAGSVPGGLEEMISEFLAPIIPWERLLMEFFTDMFYQDYSWRRPNRRYEDMYLPSLMETDEGRLDHLIYYLDVSGSITHKEVVRFNSEVKYIQEVLRPKKLTLVQFDTRIQREQSFEESDPFRDIKIVGRGGTNLDPVRQHIDKHKPTAAVIFTDLQCAPMIEPRHKTPVLWVITNSNRVAPFGKQIRISV